ncbi:S8 family serine peptidase [bacterium]|nr:S8 family serine peptidase [bacterium]
MIGPHRPGEVLVKLRPQFRRNRDICDDYAMKLLERVPLGSAPVGFTDQDSCEFLHLKLPPGQTTEQALVQLSRDPRVEYAAPNTLYQMDVRPNDPMKLPGLDKIQAPAAWDITTGSRTGPVVAVLDGGVDSSHPDLAANMWTNRAEIPGNGLDDDGNGVVDDIHGYDSARDRGDSLPKDEHGTHCAGTIGAVGDNGVGVYGLNWQAQIMGINIFDGFGASAVSIAKALNYAAQMGARIASCSFGTGVFNPVVYEAFRRSPMLHICAAGNNAKNVEAFPHYPASFELDNIVSVAATDHQDQLARFSNYGVRSVDLAAPGVDILSTVPGGGYQTLSGTSMATPTVSGVAALVATAYPQASNQEIRLRLLGGVDPVPALAGKVATGGRLNALRSLEQDSVAPSAVKGFTVQARGCSQVLLNWKAPGDDGMQGKATAYELILAQSDQTQLVPLPPPQPAGASETTSLSLLPAGQSRRLSCTLRALDHVGNAGPVQQVEVNLPPARLALEAAAGSKADWGGQGNWQVTQIPGLGPVWTDSAAGEYANNQDSSLTSRSFSLVGMRSSKLYFESRYSIEREKDALLVEASQDGGKNWLALKRLDGDSAWNIQQIDMAALDGQKDVKVRFRLKTDATGTRDGIDLGRVVVAAEP